ncbi:MAG: hypothetical protein Q8L14_23030 [Myxococcales bacterium]|nr:hypothetical protein [Myxococcales bacterium]
MRSPVASVWVGLAPDEASLEEVLLADTTACDGDGLGSAFSRAAGVPSLASAVREVKVLEAPTRSVRELLGGLSYAAALSAQLPELLSKPCTAIVVFYGVEGPSGSTVALGEEVTLTSLRPLLHHGEERVQTDRAFARIAEEGDAPCREGAPFVSPS